MPGPREGVLAPGLVVPQLPSQVIFRDLSADGKAGERERELLRRGKGEEGEGVVGGARPRRPRM